jgi:hypothetical protein
MVKLSGLFGLQSASGLSCGIQKRTAVVTAATRKMYLHL